jgi:hypothetical protein
MNSKGFSPMLAIGSLLGVIVAFYLILFIPIPSFTALRTTINYFLIVGVWILLQAMFIYAYFKLGFYSTKLFNFYKNGVLNIVEKINKLLLYYG